MPIKKVFGTILCSCCRKEIKWELQLQDKRFVRDGEVFTIKYKEGYQRVNLLDETDEQYHLSVYCYDPCGTKNFFKVSK